MSDEKVRVVVLGTGGRGDWVVSQLKKDDRYEIVALCDINEPRARRARDMNELPDIPIYASISECIEKVDFKAAVITTHDSSHAEVAVPLLNAGKYIFLEKPLDTTREKCEQIIEADKKVGGKTFVGFNLRFAPVYSTTKQLIDDGVIGDVLTIQADEFYDGGRTYFRRWNRLREFGGGLWITKASHDFDLLFWFAGRKPKSVYAIGDINHYKKQEDKPLYCNDCDGRETCYDSFYYGKEKATEAFDPQVKIDEKVSAPRPDICLYNSDKDTFDHGIATIEFEDGIVATYTCNVVSGFTNRRLRISGTKGTIDGGILPDKLILRKRDPSETEEIPLKVLGGEHGGGDALIFTEFYEFCKGLREPKVRPETASIAVLMGLAATMSQDEHRRVEMTELGID